MNESPREQEQGKQHGERERGHRQRGYVGPQLFAEHGDAQSDGHRRFRHVDDRQAGSERPGDGGCE